MSQLDDLRLERNEIVRALHRDHEELERMTWLAASSPSPIERRKAERRKREIEAGQRPRRKKLGTIRAQITRLEKIEALEEEAG